MEDRVFHSLEPEEWERLLLACRSARKTDVLAERAKARNHAILWLLFETGMRVSEVCDLRLSDVDREQGTLLIRGKGPRTRRLMLGHEGLEHLLVYLDTYRLGVATPLEQRGVSQDYLFLSETGRPLTKNGMALLFGRLRKRAGISRKGVKPSLLREGFALRFLQTGAVPCARRRRQAGKPLGSEVSSTNPPHNDEHFFLKE
jgi:site-specific recombinase XerD